MKIHDDGIREHVEWEDGEPRDLEFAEVNDDQDIDVLYFFLSAARGLLAQAVEPEDQAAADHLRSFLPYLEKLLDGPDRDVFLYGVAFGEALEELRVRVCSTFVKTGKASSRGGHKGHVATYGTDDEKAQRWGEWQAMYSKLLDGGLGKCEAREIVAEHFGVTTKSVQRRTR